MMSANAFLSKFVLYTDKKLPTKKSCKRMAKEQETPMQKQHAEIKAKYPDAILLFRVGDFYETFGDDAIKASEVLGITLTKRSNGKSGDTPLAGFPHHAIDSYLPRLVKSGFRVAVCDQLEDPKLTKTLVKRGLTELVTPGVSYNSNTIEQKSNNFVAGLHFGKYRTGAAFLDISTGEFMLSEGNDAYIRKLLLNFSPSEILYERGYTSRMDELARDKVFRFQMDDWIYTGEAAYTRLLKQFDVSSLKGFGVENLKDGLIAAGSILYYLDQTQHLQTGHITSLKRIDGEHYVWLDKFTIRNLEIFEPTSPEGKSLFDTINCCLTNMGVRTLKRYIAFPLKDLEEIRSRQELVKILYDNKDLSQTLQDELPAIGDLERLAGRAAVGRINPREIIQLKNSLASIGNIKDIFEASGIERLTRVVSEIDKCTGLRDRIEREVNEDAPVNIAKGGIFKEGVNPELDEYRRLAFSGKDYLLQLQQAESERTGIPSLKISFNNVFGYYIEVRNTYKDKVPEEWIRKQTLVNAERYITPELKEYEEKILTAEEKLSAVESSMFSELTAYIAGFTGKLQKNAAIISMIDVLHGFAMLSRKNKYVLPEVSDDLVLDIKGGRHPVIETTMREGESYIANDVHLDCDKQQIIIITGPNMAGKSALLRQTALITLLAQIGCFVPADSARIGLVDKIFTRVGASDNISMGESTFMVEMTEAAGILNNLSARSLVLFDELGRGTSTYDGISIAWAIVEYIHEHPTAKARTLFATHYHELNEMEKDFARIKNYNVSVKENDGKVIFLRKLVRGGSEHSFGIHVAKAAGIPPSIIRRANDILEKLEGDRQPKDNLAKPVKGLGRRREGYQLSLFQMEDPAMEQIREVLAGTDINNMTPVEALNKLSDIIRIID